MIYHYYRLGYSQASNQSSEKKMSSSPTLIVVFSFFSIAVIVHILYDLSNTTTYLAYCSGVSLFRAFMYTINEENVSIVKLKKEYHNNPMIREVLTPYIRTIMWFMYFRTVVFLWGTLFLSVNRTLQNQLGLISLASDFFLQYAIWQSMWMSKAKLVMAHQNPVVPMIIQLSSVLCGLYWLLNQQQQDFI